MRPIINKYSEKKKHLNVINTDDPPVNSIDARAGPGLKRRHDQNGNNDDDKRN